MKSILLKRLCESLKAICYSCARKLKLTTSAIGTKQPDDCQDFRYERKADIHNQISVCGLLITFLRNTGTYMRELVSRNMTINGHDTGSESPRV